MMLAIAPHLVDMSRAQKGNTTSLAELEPALRAEGVLGVSATASSATRAMQMHKRVLIISINFDSRSPNSFWSTAS
jgi:creatinine amidohydrolase/Fe(II)-dependent formamide hydrolase-like protein